MVAVLPHKLYCRSKGNTYGYVMSIGIQEFEGNYSTLPGFETGVVPTNSAFCAGTPVSQRIGAISSKEVNVIHIE